MENRKTSASSGSTRTTSESDDFLLCVTSKTNDPLLRVASMHFFWINAEAAIASKLLSGKCCVNMMKKLAYCLALLPNSKGDEDSWCLLMQKILLYINVHLNDIFEGLEEETKGSEAVRELVPPGKETPPPLGGHTLSEEARDNATRSALYDFKAARIFLFRTSRFALVQFGVVEGNHRGYAQPPLSSFLTSHPLFSSPFTARRRRLLLPSTALHAILHGRLCCSDHLKPPRCCSVALLKMALRGVWQLQKLVVSYCNWGGSSRAIRAFMESHLPEFKESNPQLEVVTELIRGQHPHLKGFYRNRNERVVCVKNMTPEDVLLHATRLRNALGRKVIKMRTRHVTKHPSVQGIALNYCKESFIIQQKLERYGWKFKKTLKFLAMMGQFTHKV
ncbi:hypothetical protein LWI28_014778 [Acer negundo]|uniref:Large ribosomal subunit protein mL43 n=1 Tax=Acer negundo TaxID=4023 RepID=A0AAD5ICW2_ACENE|nr:hypothetical protein LWI28_014778 [Acer negundo]